MISHNNINLAEEIKKIQDRDPGKFRGDAFKHLVRHVLKREGQNGWNKVVKTLENLNYKIPDPQKVDDLDWLPSSLGTILIVALVKIFRWQESDLIALGRDYVHFSRILKFFIRYFYSPKKTLEASVNKWRQYYTFGRLEIVKYDETKHYMVARLFDYKLHPFLCVYLRGVYGRIAEIATGSPHSEVEENKCEFRGDPYHEFIVRW